MVILFLTACAFSLSVRTIIAAADGIDALKSIAAPASEISKHGPFAGGVALGGLLTAATTWINGRERAERAKLEIEYLRTLQDAMKTKDSRIDELHKQLNALNANSTAGSDKKKK